MTLDERRIRLEALLLETAPLWQVSTFRERRPAWCVCHPDLTNALLGLDEADLSGLDGDSTRLISWLSLHLPAIGEIPNLCGIPMAGGAHPRTASHRNRGIPGRKVGQIEAFLAAVGSPVAPPVEWCAGKGHLIRNLLASRGGGGLAVERDPALCATGEILARRAGTSLRYRNADVLHETTADSLLGRHALALHACGDLHRRLITAAAAIGVPALDAAPCCYQLTAAEPYLPLCPESTLALNRLALKLAVTETVTASPRKAADSARASAWKLAFLDLRETLAPDAAYQPFRPVPARWLAADFPTFLARIAERENLALPPDLDFPTGEAAGWNRHHASRRLQLVRMAFRRALEIWILCDLAVWLERQGYTVTLREFCSRALTPRNILLSARL